MDRNRALFFALIATFGYILPIFSLSEITERDWRYFNSLSNVTRSSVLSYQEFPVHDPWVCGGVNLFANPQTRTFSPTFLLDLLFSPQTANLIYLIVLAFVGLLGMDRLLREFELSSIPRLLGSAIFVNCSWFGLHFAEGHIAYGSFQLLPWSVYAFLGLDSKKRVLLLSGIHAFYLLDGGIYPFFFSVFLLLTLVLFGIVPWRRVLLPFERFRIFTGLCIVFFLLITLPKTFPSLVELRNFENWQFPYAIPFSQFPDIFLNPFQNLNWKLPNSNFGFHEYGCYLGIVPIAFVILAAIRNPFFLGTHWRWIALSAFWFWVGSGWLTLINPWNLILANLPILNVLHLQSRVFILLMFGFAILFAKALESFNPHRDAKWAIGLVAFLLVEGLVVKSYPFATHISHQSEAPSSELISHTSWKSTVPFARKPYHYTKSEGHGSKGCYEPAVKNDSKVIPANQTTYRGEIFVTRGTGSAEISEFYPSNLKIKYTGALDITVNTMDRGHWKIREGDARITSNAGEILKIQTKGA